MSLWWSCRTPAQQSISTWCGPSWIVSSAPCTPPHVSRPAALPRAASAPRSAERQRARRPVHRPEGRGHGHGSPSSAAAIGRAAGARAVVLRVQLLCRRAGPSIGLCTQRANPGAPSRRAATASSPIQPFGRQRRSRPRRPRGAHHRRWRIGSRRRWAALHDVPNLARRRLKQDTKGAPVTARGLRDPRAGWQ